MLLRGLTRFTLTLLVITAFAVGANAQTITLDMPSWQVTEPGTGDWWRALIAEFEAQNPGVKIEFQHQPLPAYNQTMVTRFAAGNPPDILHLPAANFTVYAQSGWLLPLDAQLAATGVMDQWTPVQSSCEFEGSAMCVVILGYGDILGWNAAAFERAGLNSPPTNSEELIAFARELTVDLNGNGSIDQYGFVFPTVTHPGVEATATAFLMEFGPDAQWVNESLELNRDAVRHAWTQMRRLIEDGSVPLGLDTNGKRQFWVEGRAAMMLEGPWIQGFIDRAGPDVQPSLRVAQLPFSGQVRGGASNVLAIPSMISPERQALAWRFIELFMSPEWQAAYSTVAGQPPARAGVLTDEFLAENPNMREYVAAASVGRDYIPRGTELVYTRFRDLIIEATLDVVVQGRDIDTVMNTLQRDILRLR